MNTVNLAVPNDVRHPERSAAQPKDPEIRKHTTVSSVLHPTALALAACTLILAPALTAQTTIQTAADHRDTVAGIVRDPLGAAVPGATVELLSAGKVIAQTISGPSGAYSLAVPASGRYILRTSAPTFAGSDSSPLVLSAHGFTALNLTLATPTDTQQITVSVTGTPLPEAQAGASVSVLSEADYRLMPEIQEPLRLVPGVQITQSGQTGGTSGLRIRGGDTDANKVLIDGVPANQVGGGVDFANLATVGIASIEVLREPNSALYGSDALSGVVSLSTARAGTRLPLFTYAGDAGNFGTYRNEVTAGTLYRKFDLFSAFARLDTRNSEPNSQFHNATYAGNFGYAPNPANDLRFTVRHLAVTSGQPNSIALYGIADDSQQKEQDTYYNAVWNGQTTQRWHNQIRYGGLRENGSFNSFGATGVPDSNGYFDGKSLTISGANGYSVTGAALFQYSASPSTFAERNTRDFVYAQTDYRLNPHLNALGAFKYESETGLSGTQTPLERGNFSYTAQFAGDIHNRLFFSAGSGFEDNGLFGFAATPRVSVAYYLFRPSGTGTFAGTKLHGTFGKGIKEPSIFQQQNSLYATLQANALQSVIDRFNVHQVGPENSRTFDAGVDQQLFNGRVRLGLTYFHNQFTNRVEYVPGDGLVQLGVPGSVALNSNYLGAYLNSSAFRSQGLEFESEYRLSNHLFARGGYTYTDAVVERSFSSDNQDPVFNTSAGFSNVQIGAYSPLVGARPFRIAPHTGYFALNYTQQKFYTSFSGTLVGKRDDSDFLSDPNFGNSLLLPNRNLLGAYQRLTLGGGYNISRRIDAYTEIQNLLSQHYQEAFGYPALPLTFRSGLRLTFGGESFSIR